MAFIGGQLSSVLNTSAPGCVSSALANSANTQQSRTRGLHRNISEVTVYS